MLSTLKYNKMLQDLKARRQPPEFSRFQTPFHFRFLYSSQARRQQRLCLALLCQSFVARLLLPFEKYLFLRARSLCRYSLVLSMQCLVSLVLQSILPQPDFKRIHHDSVCFFHP